MRSARWARRAPVLPAIRPSSRPPRNISSSAMSVRIAVATTKRPGTPPQLAKGQLHRAPPPVVASIGSMARTRRAAATALTSPRTSNRAAQMSTARGSKLSDERSDRGLRERREEQRAQHDAAADDDQHLHQERSHQHARRRADRAQQRERPGLLKGDDEEEQPGHQRHDEREQQEDQLEGPLHLRDAGRLLGRLRPGEGVGLAGGVVDPGGQLRGRHPRRGAHADRAGEDRRRRRDWPPGWRPRSPPTATKRVGVTWICASAASPTTRSSARRRRPPPP